MTKWYVQRGKQCCGPFDYLEVIRQLQSKSLFESDLVWTKGLTEWSPIGSLRDFCAERIQEVLNSQKDSGIFERRKHPRAAMSLPVWAHDHEMVWPGRTLSLSAQGAGLSIPNPGLAPGDVIKLHIKNRLHQWALSLEAKILSKGYRKNDEKVLGDLSYNVMFVDLEAQAATALSQSVLREGNGDDLLFQSS